ncbi:MAG: lysophospholipase [Clostridiales bacterium]|nr:lysophospholipase [Clostridiales bacterium]
MKIVFYGDSITDMGRHREQEIGNVFSFGQGYPFLVSASLLKPDPNAHVLINRGIAGDRIVDLYARLKADVWNHQPDVVSILIGVNDVWHEINWQNGVELDRFEKMYRMLIEDTKKVLPKVKFLLLEPFVLEECATTENMDKFLEVKKYAKVVKSIAEDTGAVFVPLQDRFDTLSKQHGVKPYLYDGVHPNLAGASVIADAWLEGFNKL